MIVTSKLQKWGNSTAVRIPKKALEELKLSEGQEMKIYVRKEGLLLSPIDEHEPLNLADFLRDATPESAGEEWDWGPDVGKEIIDD